MQCSCSACACAGVGTSASACQAVVVVVLRRPSSRPPPSPAMGPACPPPGPAQLRPPSPVQAASSYLLLSAQTLSRSSFKSTSSTIPPIDTCPSYACAPEKTSRPSPFHTLILNHTFVLVDVISHNGRYGCSPSPPCSCPSAAPHTSSCPPHVMERETPMLLATATPDQSSYHSSSHRKLSQT